MGSPVLQRNNVHVVGSGAPTIVFAHGFGTDQAVWKRQVDALAPRHRLVLFDHVGAGSTDPAAYSSRRYRSLAAYASDLLEIYAALELTDTVYVGHSMSGMIGVLAGIAQPKIFRKMVLLCASPRYLNDEGYTGGFDQAGLDRLYQVMSVNYHAWASGFADLAMPTLGQPQLTADFASTLSAVRPDVAMAVLRIIFEADYRAELPRLKVPTLVLQPAEDVLVPRAVGEYLARHIPGSKLVLVPGSGHLPHVYAPDAVNEAIRDFISS